MTKEQKRLYEEMMKPVDLLVSTCDKHCKEHGQKAVSLIILKEFAKVLKKKYKEGFEKNYMPKNPAPYTQQRT